jgi:hypothetical protein
VNFTEKHLATSPQDVTESISISSAQLHNVLKDKQRIHCDNDADNKLELPNGSSLQQAVRGKLKNL